jgi:YhcH/YjgK/YiaL family protein
MAMLGKIQDLTPLVQPQTRLRRGLELLQDCRANRLPEVAKQITALAPGETQRIVLDGDAFYLILQCYQPKPRDAGKFEAHARHTDLQFLWSGCECIEVCDLRAQAASPAYNSDGNFFFPMGTHPYSRLVLHAGEVAVLTPADAHAPCLQVEGHCDELVRKIVVKIQDAHLTSGSGAFSEKT